MVKWSETLRNSAEGLGFELPFGQLAATGKSLYK